MLTINSYCPPNLAIDVNNGYITDTTKTATPIPITVSKIGSKSLSSRAIYFESIDS